MRSMGLMLALTPFIAVGLIVGCIGYALWLGVRRARHIIDRHVTDYLWIKE